jgi:hypothetical protein
MGTLALNLNAAEKLKSLPTADLHVGSSSYLIEVGTTLQISPDSVLKSTANKGYPKGQYYQWQKDGVEIAGATNSSYVKTNVSFADVGEYVLVFTGAYPGKSGPIYVSVYSLFSQHSNGGALSTPIGDFTTSSSTVCAATGFDKYKVYFPFYGPNANPQSGTYQNTSMSPLLDLTTCTNANKPTLDTAIKIQGNWLGMPELACTNDDASCTNGTLLTTLTNFSLSTNPGPISNTNSYRATVYFKSSTLGGNTNVTLRWYYHN